MITGYNTSDCAAPVRNLSLIIGKPITMQGSIVHQLAEKYEEEFYATFSSKVARGEIKYLEQIFNGLEKASDAVIAVSIGSNTGKAVTHVADD